MSRLGDRRNHNAHALDVWLRLYGREVPKTGGMINLEAFGKPGPESSYLPEWLSKRWTDEKVRATDKKLAKLINRLKRRHYELWDKLWIAHLSESHDARILDRWKKREYVQDAIMLELYSKALRWILNRLDEDDFWLTLAVKDEDLPVSSMHEAKMNERIASKKEEREEIAKWVRDNEDEYEGRMSLMDAAAARFSVHPDTIRAAVRYYDSIQDGRRGSEARRGAA